MLFMSRNRPRAYRDEHGKTCPVCQEHKPWDDYHKNTTARDGHQSYCKACAYRMTQESRERHREAWDLRAAEKLARTPDPRAMKICTKCGVERPVLDYYRHRSTKDGRATWCKFCQRAYTQERRERDWEAAREAHRAWISTPEGKAIKAHSHRRYWLRQYGLTVDQYEQMLTDQGGVCAICHKPERFVDPRSGEPRRLAVDHDHETGKVRGLLCGRCNRAIGHLGHDPESLARAADYLKAAMT